MSILNLIGNTPLVEIQNPEGSTGVRIFGKLEGNNPGGSIKDRIAVYMIRKAEELD
jgi:S-sulfo-L-cysteine synthase (O-acetyl-L-serine-dependent)